MMSSPFDTAVLYWSRIAHIGFIGCDSKNKGVSVSDWPKLDLDNEDYEGNLRKGLYKDGIAIRLGKCLKNGNQKQLYSLALDFDGWDAVLAWFGNWENVKKLSQRTRVEWHFDQYKIHVLYLANRPIKNKVITIKDSKLEIWGENHLLFASPSIHKEGNAYTALGTEEIMILSDWLLLQLEAKIESISEGYMSNDNKQEYIAYLEDSKTKIRQGGRHTAVLALGNSYFFRYSGIWHKMHDDQRFDELVNWDHHHCEPPLFETNESEFKQIWNDIVRRGTGKRQEERDKREDQGQTTVTGEGDEDEPPLVKRLAETILEQEIFVTAINKSGKEHDSNEMLYWYSGKGLYLLGQEWRIKEKCQEMESTVKTEQVKEVINYIKRSTYVDREQFDSNPYIRNIANGLLDLNTKELKPHTPDYLSQTQLPIERLPEAKCLKIEKFLSDVLKPDDIKYILQLIGYCLLNDCRYQVSVMLYGNEGANGKGTLLDLVTTFLGADNCSHRSLQSIDNNRFAVADLFGKMANTYADLKTTKLSETGNFKMLVTGDWITGEFKMINSFKFRNKAKLWFSANEIPESDDKTDAYYRRWLIFHFDKRFIGGNENVNLINEITTPEELSGLLNLALEGLSDLIKEGGFHYKTIEEIRKDYEIHTNDVNAFVNEECLVDITNIDYATLATDLYAAYCTFCAKRQTRPIDMNPFGKKLAAKGIYNQRHGKYPNDEHYYDGVILLKSMKDREQTTI